MTNQEREEIEKFILSEIDSIAKEISALKEITAPIEPDVAIGRLTRIDAMQAKEINQAVLRKAKLKLQKLESSLERVDDEEFGVCRICEEDIPIERMKIMPESTRCVACAEGRRD